MPMIGDIQKKICSIQVTPFKAIYSFNEFSVENLETLVDALYEYARRLHEQKLSQTQLAIFSAIALVSPGSTLS